MQVVYLISQGPAPAEVAQADQLLKPHNFAVVRVGRNGTFTREQLVVVVTEQPREILGGWYIRYAVAGGCVGNISGYYHPGKQAGFFIFDDGRLEVSG